MRSIVLAAYNLMRLLTWPVWALWWRYRRSSAAWIVLNLRGSLDELPRAPARLLRLLPSMRAARRSTLEVRKLCERIADDPHARGLLLRVEQLDAGYATLTSLRHELTRLRARGKEVVCYLPLDASQRELFLASAADRVLAMPHSGFSALGPLASRTYVAGLLGKLGVGIVVTAEGRYKSAADPLVRESMSEPEREQLTAIIEVLHRSWLAAVGARPQLGQDGARALLETGLFGAARARELGAIDEVAYEDELPARLGLAARETPSSHERYLKRSGRLPALLVALQPAQRVALVRLVGAISERGGTSANPGIDLHGTIATLRALAHEKQIVGVILYVDSPGGSALVSELLHREITRLDAQKPVVTWMGNVAASGGYYLAAATRAIIAQPTTLTGSIGVISIRPVTAALFAKLGVSRDAVALTPFADMGSFMHRPSAAEDALLRSETARFYERFLDVVALGRKRTREQVAELAQGRVWSGFDAHAHGLVDVLGGYHEARAALDALLPSTARRLQRTPVLVTPKPKTSPTFPPPAAADRAAGLLELAPVRELWQLASSGERVFAYAATLPTLE